MARAAWRLGTEEAPAVMPPTLPPFGQRGVKLTNLAAQQPDQAEHAEHAGREDDHRPRTAFAMPGDRLVDLRPLDPRPLSGLGPHAPEVPGPRREQEQAAGRQNDPVLDVVA